MKSNFTKIFFILILSSLLNVSCGKGNEEKLIQHLADCTAILEACEENCKPTPEQQEQFSNDLFKCIFHWEENGFSSYYECHLWVETQIFGSVTPDQCREQCKEKYYECLFGSDWKDLNIKKP